MLHITCNIKHWYTVAALLLQKALYTFRGCPNQAPHLGPHPPHLALTLLESHLVVVTQGTPDVRLVWLLHLFNTVKGKLKKEDNIKY